MPGIIINQKSVYNIVNIYFFSNYLFEHRKIGVFSHLFPEARLAVNLPIQPSECRRERGGEGGAAAVTVETLPEKRERGNLQADPL